MMGKHRDLKRDFALAGNKQCCKLSTNGIKQLTSLSLTGMEMHQGLAKLGRHQRHRLTVYRLATKGMWLDSPLRSLVVPGLQLQKWHFRFYIIGGATEDDDMALRPPGWIGDMYESIAYHYT
jgi:hypothetical protein